jgi:hypothetical protein
MLPRIGKKVKTHVREREQQQQQQQQQRDAYAIIEPTIMRVNATSRAHKTRAQKERSVMKLELLLHIYYYSAKLNSKSCLRRRLYFVVVWCCSPLTPSLFCNFRSCSSSLSNCFCACLLRLKYNTIRYLLATLNPLNFSKAALAS